ncbi:protein kinase [Streptomyces sp. NPDC019890]|uniref:protein kinase domain-containing protein n=1 Tax=Streptomyces sp. NPDC019890 TaxID=3365064 RepID=UPI00384E92AD
MLSPLTHDDPAQLGSYRLIARLGSGGMGTVYLARSAGGRTLALKTMHAGIATDPAFRTRFHLETDAARIIGSHHGATVVDADPLAETPWLATEYVLGPPLDDAVSLSGPLPEASVRALGAALAGALSQLHASDVVHRDLKPSNVMVTAYGPKIIDFGIARAAGDDRLTRTGAAAGTPAFMSPEQATGQEHTPAGDVFALAGVLTYAATGHGAFGTGQAADLLYRVRYADPDLTGVPKSLIPILTRCLSKDPAQRPSTSELAAQLHDGQGQFADHLPDTLLGEITRRATEVWQHQPYRLPPPADHALAPTVPSTAPSGMTRRKILAISSGSALAVAAAGAGAWSWLKSPSGSTASSGAQASPVSNGNATSAAPSPTEPADRRQIWRKNIRTSPLLLAPMAVNEMVAMMTDNGLIGLTAVSGERRWLTDTVKHPRHVQVDGKKIYALLPGGSHGHQLALHTVDSASGRTTPAASFAKWDKPLQEAALLRVSGTAVYLIARKGTPADSAPVKSGSWSVMAVALGTGKQLWSFPIPSYDMNSPADFMLSALVGGLLVLCRTAKDEKALQISARNATTGVPVWEATVAKADADDTPLRPGVLAADDSHVYVGGDLVQALRLTDGKVGWTFGEGRAAGSYGTPVLKRGMVYTAEKRMGVVVLSAADGRLRWGTKSIEDPDIRVPPAVGNDYMFFVGETGGHASEIRKQTGTWSFKPSAPSLCLHEGSKRLILADGKQVLAIRFDITY